jgi:hypothetical protein
VLVGPRSHLAEGLPERGPREIRIFDVRPRDDQRVEASLTNLIKRLVVGVDVRLALRPSLDPVHRERVDEQLNDGVRSADQPDVLLLRDLERRIGHQVQQADV